jgi:hypothetical protein
MTKMTAAQRKARTSRRTAQAVFGLGVLVSLTANVMASAHTVVGIGTGLWAPVAFLAAMAMMENVPAKGLAGKLRFTGIVFLAGIAGWVSYGHLTEVFTQGGADTLSAHLLPLTVDVMMAFAGPAMKVKAAAPARRRVAAKKPATKSNVRSIRPAA